jgi:peptidoglycan/xylan/chitin deacetylase (PgdA/CDA1 family)
MKKPDLLLRQNDYLWDLYTKKEEYGTIQLDRYGRFSSQSSSQKKIESPEISQFLFEQGWVPEYPDNKKFAVCLTHDVDEIYPPWHHMFSSCISSLMKFRLRECNNQWLWKFKGKESSPYWNFREIMNLERKYDAKSTFYFLATDRDVLRFRYSLDDLKDELGFIHDSGWEIGLHGGYYSYDNADEIIKEKKRIELLINSEITGYRSHYLRFRVPDTWKVLIEAGFTYDSTFGYADRMGFRNGTCYPFNPYDVQEKKELDILEIQMNSMDTTLFDTSRNYQDAWMRMKHLIDTVMGYNGVITINWHSTAFNCPFMAQREQMYKDILEYCYQKNAWMTNGSDLVQWWEKIINIP